jgi:hypothetical protein
MTWRASDKTTENLPRPDRPFDLAPGRCAVVERQLTDRSQAENASMLGCSG